MMRIVVIDSDKAFVTSLAARCQKASIFCQAIAAPASAIAEIKKNPDAVDLVLIAKELEGSDGLQVAQALRKDPKTVDVPYVLMSSTWGKAEFAKHQKTEFGANAYFSKKSALPELEATIEAVTGIKFGAAAAAAVNAPANGNTGSILNIKLEAASDVVNIAEDVPSDISMSEPIALFTEESAAEAPAAPKAPKIPTTPVISSPAAAAPPKAAAPSVQAPSISVPVQSTGPIDIMGGGGAAAKPGKPAAKASDSPQLNVMAPSGPDPAVPQVEGSLFAIDLNAGSEPEGVAPSAPPKAAPVPAPTPEAVAVVEVAAPKIEVSAPVVEAAPAVVAAPAAVAAPADSGGIEISLGFESAAIETSSPPVPSAPVAAAPAEPAAIEAPVVAAVVAEAASSIDIGFSVGAEPVAAPAAEIPAAPSADLISLDGGLSIGGEAPAAEMPPPAPAMTSGIEAAAPIVAAAPEIQAPPAPPATVSEEEAAADLPYLFAGGASSMAASPTTTFTRSTPLAGGSSTRQLEGVGGSSGNEDVDTLKKYLTMREQDVSVLTAQLSYAKEELGKCETSIKRLTLQGEDLFHQINDLKAKNTTLEQELTHASKNREGEVDQLRFEVKAKIDRIKFLEDRLNDSAQQYEKLKERVRLDIRKIRIREKELESKLEILKKDSETLIGARENKILELKRKIDLLEFNYDTLQDKNELEKQNVVKGNEKIDRVLKVLKLAVGVIEAEGEQTPGEAKGELTGPATGHKVA